MANLHLITGYAGAAHVTAADAGSFNVAILGEGQYVLNRGNKFAASVITNNKIRISDGDILMQGRHIRLNEGETVDLTIENGASGYYRNDLIVARYTKNSDSGIEECNLVVINGTAVTSGPADPEYTSGDIINDHVLQADMPLYRVPLNGLNVQELEPLFTLVSVNLSNAGSDKQLATDKLTTGSDLANGDYIPFYDVSAGDHKKTLWSNIISKIKTALFGVVNGVLKADGGGNISVQTVDATPKENSANLVTSGGAYSALADKAAKPVILWENASPTSGFAAQNVTLVDECVDCNRFDFYFNTDLDAGLGNATFTLYLDEGQTYTHGYASFVYRVDSTYKIYTRFFDVTMGSKQSYFGTGYFNASADAVTMVPLKIIGYKD